jgi:hypothetical protein
VRENPWLRLQQCGVWVVLLNVRQPRSNQTPQFSKMTLSAQKEKPDPGSVMSQSGVRRRGGRRSQLVENGHELGVRR